MAIAGSFDVFCKKHYKEALKVAEKTVAKFINDMDNKGPLRNMDIELIKSAGVYNGLEAAFKNYDENREGKASIKTYLSTIVWKKVLSELEKAYNAAIVKVTFVEDVRHRDSDVPDNENVPDYDDYSENSGSHGGNDGQDYGAVPSIEDWDVVKRCVKKEELIKDLLSCLKKFKGIDRVILYCWMLYPRGEYLGKALEELGWEDNEDNRNLISTKRNRAIERLKREMEQRKRDFIAISSANAIVPTTRPKRPKTASEDLIAIRHSRPRRIYKLDMDKLSASLTERFNK